MESDDDRTWLRTLRRVRTDDGCMLIEFPHRELGPLNPDFGNLWMESVRRRERARLKTLRAARNARNPEPPAAA